MIFLLKASDMILEGKDSRQNDSKSLLKCAEFDLFLICHIYINLFLLATVKLPANLGALKYVHFHFEWLYLAPFYDVFPQISHRWQFKVRRGGQFAHNFFWSNFEKGQPEG